MNIPSLAAVGGVTVICWLCGLAVRLSPWDNKYIPLLCGLLGGALGALGLSVMPGFPADNIIDAVAVGVASGLAATGADQIFKQLSSE